MRCSSCKRFMPGHGPAWAMKCDCEEGRSRCPKCGRLKPGNGPGWAAKCCCAAPQAPGDKGPQVPEHPCGGCDTERHMDCVFSSGMPSCDSLALWLAAVPMAAMLAAIRDDKVVGEGTCSRVSECCSDGDLRRELALAGCDTVAKALRWARDDERLFLEQGLNQREGNDDDWQLAAYRDFEAADKANPV